jgi:hypothetical protein
MEGLDPGSSCRVYFLGHLPEEPGDDWSQCRDARKAGNKSNRCRQDGFPAEFTHDMPLAAVLWIFSDSDKDGVEEAYREFRLDINEDDTDAEH